MSRNGARTAETTTSFERTRRQQSAAAKMSRNGARTAETATSFERTRRQQSAAAKMSRKTTMPFERTRAVRRRENRRNAVAAPQVPHRAALREVALARVPRDEADARVARAARLRGGRRVRRPGDAAGRVRLLVQQRGADPAPRGLLRALRVRRRALRRLPRVRDQARVRPPASEIFRLRGLSTSRPRRRPRPVSMGTHVTSHALPGTRSRTSTRSSRATAASRTASTASSSWRSSSTSTTRPSSRRRAAGSSSPPPRGACRRTSNDCSSTRSGDEASV